MRLVERGSLWCRSPLTTMGAAELRASVRRLSKTTAKLGRVIKTHRTENSILQSQVEELTYRLIGVREVLNDQDAPKFKISDAVRLHVLLDDVKPLKGATGG